jgi:hypothetical protein
MARRTTIIALKSGTIVVPSSPWPAPTGKSRFDAYEDGFVSSGHVLDKPSAAHRLFGFLAATARRT